MIPALHGIRWIAAPRPIKEPDQNPPPIDDPDPMPESDPDSPPQDPPLPFPPVPRSGSSRSHAAPPIPGADRVDAESGARGKCQFADLQSHPT